MSQNRLEQWDLELRDSLLRSEGADGDLVYRIVHSSGARSEFPPFASSRSLSARARVGNRSGDAGSNIARQRDRAHARSRSWSTPSQMAHGVPAASTSSPAPPPAVAYRLQADRLGELDPDCRRLLDRIGSGSSEGINCLVANLNRPRTELRPGTLLTRGSWCSPTGFPGTARHASADAFMRGFTNSPWTGNREARWRVFWRRPSRNNAWARPGAAAHGLFSRYDPSAALTLGELLRGAVAPDVGLPIRCNTSGVFPAATT